MGYSDGGEGSLITEWLSPCTFLIGGRVVKATSLVVVVLEDEGSSSMGTGGFSRNGGELSLSSDTQGIAIPAPLTKTTLSLFWLNGCIR